MCYLADAHNCICGVKKKKKMEETEAEAGWLHLCTGNLHSESAANPGGVRGGGTAFAVKTGWW